MTVHDLVQRLWWYEATVPVLPVCAVRFSRV